MVNQLIAENKVDKFHRFCKLFNTSPHNMLNLNIDSRVVAIIIDLAPQFNIPKFKNDFVETYLNEIYQQLSNCYIYHTYIYKHPLSKKIFVEINENSYDLINTAAQEIEYLISNVLRIYRALIINLGRYKEYFYLNYFLKKYYYGNNIIYKFINIRHYSNYSKNDWNLNCNNFTSDMNIINKNVKYLESWGIK